MIHFPRALRNLHCQQLSLLSGVYYFSAKAALNFLFFKDHSENIGIWMQERPHTGNKSMDRSKSTGSISKFLPT